MLHHYLLRLRRALRCQHVLARIAAIVIRLQRLGRGTGHVAGRVLRRPRDAGHRSDARPKDRCAMADRHGTDADGHQQLLDVADEPLHQSGPSYLAAGCFGLGTVDMFCTSKCGRLSLYARRVAWRGCRSIESSAQRGRQRRNVHGADSAGKTRSISCAAARREPRSL